MRSRRWGLFFALLLLCETLIPTHAQAATGYWKAATYTSDAWVINFWNTESDHMESELARIRADGFNSIILVLPWREFQPETIPVSYNSYAFRKLDRVMDAAAGQGLGVIIRLGYTWDYYEDESSAQRFRELLRDAKVREAWHAYAKKIYDAVSAHGNFLGGFITWEDMWNYVEDTKDLGVGTTSRTEAKKIGFQDFLKENYTLRKLNQIFEPEIAFSGFDDIYIPPRNHAAYRLFFEFYDDWLNDILRSTQQVFPGLSMEVRLDWDVLPGAGENGEDLVCSHEGTFSCGDAEFTSTMYSVSMGQDAGRQLTAADAVRGMTEELAHMRDANGDKPIFVDQLLYMDETEGYDSNARLQPSQRGAFLTAITGVLSAYTNGYGIWTYRNYGNNPVYNCQFALGKNGWDVDGGVVTEHNGSQMMKLAEGCSISQKIGHRIGDKTTHDNYVRFTADSEEPVTLRVTMGRESREVTVEGSQSYELNLGKFSYYTIEFAADGDVWLDNIQVYNFVQDGQLYDMDGDPLSCIEAMRTLNASMP
ncbi:MAG: hypothetical protein LUE65_04140 [Clostridiales bacterium]|nr:hypothetical protein [Clostridiales bacterium]